MIKGWVQWSSRRWLVLAGRPSDIQLVPAAARSAEHSAGPVSQLPAETRQLSQGTSSGTGCLKLGSWVPKHLNGGVLA